LKKRALTIAIDGYSSTGKSTLAKSLAKALNLIYVDSGAMYRAVTLYGLRHGCIEGKKVEIDCLLEKLSDINIEFVNSSDPEEAGIHLNGVRVEEEIRTMEVNQVVSAVSSISPVRRKLVEIQQTMGVNGGVVMDGRDIGTVVFPNADFKIYMTADADIRAQRRYDELLAKGKKVEFEEVKNNLLMRDKQDQGRLDSPLLKADDAVELNNSYLNTKEQIQWAMEAIKDKVSV
jgi:cytidylate kinase